MRRSWWDVIHLGSLHRKELHKDGARPRSTCRVLWDFGGEAAAAAALCVSCFSFNIVSDQWCLLKGQPRSPRIRLQRQNPATSRWRRRRRRPSQVCALRPMNPGEVTRKADVVKTTQCCCHVCMNLSFVLQMLQRCVKLRLIHPQPSWWERRSKSWTRAKGSRPKRSRAISNRHTPRWIWCDWRTWSVSHWKGGSRMARWCAPPTPKSLQARWESLG